MNENQTQLSAFIIGLTMCVVFSFLLAGFYAVSQLPGVPFVIDSKINPNNAEMASLVRLPGLGPSKAFEIVSYRQGVVEGQSAFDKASDLYAVSGLGPATVEKMSAWLKFE
jgi:competence ComEA-like helix-hairpin-helix protein